MKCHVTPGAGQRSAAGDIDTFVVQKAPNSASVAHTARFTDVNAMLGLQIVAAWRASHALLEMLVGVACMWMRL